MQGYFNLPRPKASLILCLWELGISEKISVHTSELLLLSPHPSCIANKIHKERVFEKENHCFPRFLEIKYLIDFTSFLQANIQ